jgi:4-methyl-5(b-hydroxyethyl)-thiazole monophosphate biosynthesis
MYEALVFLVDGFEEVEALATVDILRRGGVNTATVSLTGSHEVTGSHAIPVLADKLFPDFEMAMATMLILPGGPGTPKYKQHKEFLQLIKTHHEMGGRISAICAAPSILGMLGLLEGKKACCYPGFETELMGAVINNEPVITDGNIITGQSAGASLLFGLAVLSAIKGEEIAKKISVQMRI